MPPTMQEQIGTVRQRTIAALDALNAAIAKTELPPSPEALNAYRRKLAAGLYTVLVVGEAKRGKSSFINAIIGRELLPTAETIATSQAFRIHDAATDRFQVRYADGSQTQIGREELARYGSQVLADRVGIPTANEVINWIDVEVPARFLPRGVTLIDTPGVGSLYMSHAQITHRFVADADAVIFVLDSERPIIQEELEFLTAILQVTKSVFFVQTKIDLYSRDEWGAILARNQEILHSRFADALPKVTIWPCSNKHLLRAASNDDPDYLRASRYEDLAVALQTFLFRNAGWLVAAEAVSLAAITYNAERPTLAARLATLTDASGQQAAELETQLQVRKQAFDADWGIRGERYQTLRNDLSALAVSQQQHFLTMLRAGGLVDRAIHARIAAVRSFEEAERFNRALPGTVVAEAQQNWRQVRQETEIQARALLGPLLDATAALRFPEGLADKFTADDRGGTELMQTTSYQDLVRAVYQTHGRIIHAVADYMVRADIINSAEAVAYAEWAARLWAMAYGWYRRNQIERGAAQQQLLAHLEDVRGYVESYYTSPFGSTQGRSVVQYYFDELVHLVGEQIDLIVSTQSQAAQEELDRLASELNLDREQRQARVATAQAQLDEWDGVGRSLRAVADDLNALALNRDIPARNN